MKKISLALLIATINAKGGSKNSNATEITTQDAPKISRLSETLSSSV